MHPAEQKRWHKLAQRAGSTAPTEVDRTIIGLPADAARLRALGLLWQTPTRINLTFSQWLEQLPKPVPEPEPALLELVTEHSVENDELVTLEAAEVVALESVSVWPAPAFDPSVPSALFLRALPYGGGSSVETVVESGVAELSSRLFLSGLPWNGPQEQISLVEMMARATQDAVQRSQQTPAPAALASALSSHDFLQQLPWNLGAEQ